MYGTDDTVYLTVSVTDLGAYGIIDDVDSVITGIDNAKIEIYTDAHVMGLSGMADNTAWSYGTYTLYNEDGDIIAAVVVGEDGTKSENLVFAHTGSVASERYDKTTGEWTWTRKVVLNGEEVTLTEVGDGLSELDTMVQGEWYQVAYNADGNVVEVLDVDDPDALGAIAPGNNKLIDDYMDIEVAVDDEDTVLYYQHLLSINDLKLVGKSLSVDENAYYPFRVSEDVNVVLMQYNNNKLNTYFESGVKALDNMIDELNDRHAAYDHDYEFNAILEEGIATVIIIEDDDRDCDDYSDVNWEDESGNLDLKAMFVDASGYVNIRVETPAALTTSATATVTITSANGGTVLRNQADVGFVTMGTNVYNFGFLYGAGNVAEGDYHVNLKIVDGSNTYTYNGLMSLI